MTLRLLSLFVCVLLSATLTRAAGPGPRLDSLITGPSADYIIISPAAWTSALNGYVTAKTGAGFSPRVFSTENVLAEYAGTNEAERIRDFLTDAYTNWPLTHVLLVGHTNDVPSFTVGGFEVDTYYARLDGDDFETDVYVGRLLAVSSSEVERISGQWASYDCRGWGRTEFGLTGEEGIYDDATNTLDQFGWSAHHINATNLFVTVPIEEVNAQMSNTQVLINWSGHGLHTLWEVTRRPMPNLWYYRKTNAWARSQTNLPFVNALRSCYTGRFMDTGTIASCFMRAPEGGAIGYIGANQIVYAGGSDPNPKNINQLNDDFEARFQDAYLRTGFVEPAACFFESLSGKMFWVRAFNYLGDPTAVMDLRPAYDDTSAPYINYMAVAPTQLTAGMSVTCLVTAIDGDQVGVVSVSIDRPGIAAWTNEMTYDASQSAYTCVLDPEDTATTGEYSWVVVAKDISQNTVLDTGPVFRVLVDAAPPEMLAFSVAPTQTYQGSEIAVSLSATDTVGLAEVYVDIVDPSDETNRSSTMYGSVNIRPLVAGLYRVQGVARDYYGNAVQTNGVFNVLADAAAPAMEHAWFAFERVHIPGTVEPLAWTDACPYNICCNALASDGESLPADWTAWSLLTDPSGTTWSNMMSQNPDWSSNYFSYLYLDQTGTYEAVCWIADAIGNTVASEPFYAHIGARPRPHVHERDLTGTQGVLRIFGAPDADMRLLARTSLVEGAWYEPEAGVVSVYTNGYFEFSIPIPESLTEQYYRGATNDL